MSANWDYSKMTQAASEAGGPELYIKSLKDDGERKGALKALVIMAFLSSCIYIYRKRTAIGSLIRKMRLRFSIRFKQLKGNNHG